MAVRDDPREQLPRGTVTLLFADVEGSSKLLQALGDRYADLRSRKRELVRSIIAPRGGHEVDWAGDGAFLAFHRAQDAVHAAVELQRALESEEWPAEHAVRLRIGIHTGEPRLDADGYVGEDVHVAARICSAAHGGQIVVSRTTREFFGEGGDVAFRPLGSHRLKDVPHPEQLFQVLAAGLADAFPPLRTLGGATLPSLHHRLVGRRQDLTATLALLGRPEVRLVTLTGPGGAGKSRLALEVAALTAVERPVHLVGLAPVADPALVPAAVAAVLGVRESPGRPLAAGIADALAGTGALVFLDNLEHLSGAAPFVSSLLDAVPDLDVLVTSRTPLRLSAEHVVPLDPLEVNDAATLFAELAAARGVVLREDTLPAVREICRRLDGLPLAIELVAARLAILPPSQLLKALDEGLALDMEGPVDLPERQRTLRATIDWSYGLLGEPQRRLHEALAVFVGGATLDDARALAEDTASFFADLEALVAGSLVRSDVSNGSVRLFILETVREHALESVRANGRLDELQSKHAARLVEIAIAAEAELAGPDQGAWLDRLEPELDNLRAALGWCIASGRAADALRATCALGRFWRMHGHVGEARDWLARGLERARQEETDPDVVANALWWSARLAAAQDDLRAERPLLEEALALFTSLGKRPERSFVLGELGWIALQDGDLGRAEQLCQEALAVARETGDAATISGQLNYLADVHSARGEHAAALAAHEEALALRRTLDDPMLVANSTYNLGIAAWESGDVERARRAFEETFALASRLGDVIHIAAADFMLAELDLASGALDDAERRIRTCLATYAELGNARSRAECLVVLGGVAAARGSHDTAARLVGAADRLRAGAPVNRFEAPVLEHVLPLLEDALGARLAELRERGATEELEAETGVVSGAARH